jgi:dienelactone hydrolase
VRTPADWIRRRAEIRHSWEKETGTWPPQIERPALEILASSERDNFTQKRIRLQIAPDQFTEGYLLVPHGKGPFPAVVVPFYDPETSIGVGKSTLRDFAYQLSRRGYVTLSIGSPGGDARKPDLGSARHKALQPLHFLGYIAANSFNALTNLPNVDPGKIGIVGHSYGGKWAMFAACFNDKFACGVWSDPGIVFDETRGNINYWEPWYLGLDPKDTRKPGLVTSENPRTGAYRHLYENGHDLHEVLALMAPRPFLVSGGAEDPLVRWQPLNRVNEVYELLGKTHRIALSTRPAHDPTPHSNEQIYMFFDRFLKSASNP